MSRHVATLLALFAATAHAQSVAEETIVRRATPLEEAAQARLDVSVTSSESDPPRVLLRWNGNVLPLQTARERVAVGMITPDLFVALVGGVRHSLDVFFLAANGAVGRLATNGGRRLPPAFNDGQGSWPVAIGRDLFVVPFAKDGRIELRVVGFGDQVFATRTLPEATTGFDVQPDPCTLRITIVPRGVAGEHPLELAHPRAPKIQFGEAVLEFGAVPCGGQARQTATVHNPGVHPVEIELYADGDFRTEPRRLRIQAGERIAVSVTFTPAAARECRGRLVARHASEERPLVLALRGHGIEQATETAALTFTPPAPPRAEAEAAKRTAPAALTLTAPAPAPAPSPVAAVAREPRPPHLHRAGDALVVRGEPGETLLLALVTLQRGPDGVAPLRPVAVWRGTLGSDDGLLKVGVRTLAPDPSAFAVIALRRGPLVIQESNLVELAPDRAASLR